MWQRSFVGVWMALGGTVEEATSMLAVALPDGDLLRDPRRAVRATAIARVNGEIAIAIGEITLR